MFALAHMGFTLAAVQVLNRVPVGRNNLSSPAIPEAANNGELQPEKSRLMPRMDIRLLLFGSLLPDIIDKPLGNIILRDTLDNSRIYSHTLLFAVIISLLAFYLWKGKGQLWLLPVAVGVIMHLVLDQMWLKHCTLLWPLCGGDFTPVGIDPEYDGILNELVTTPSLYITEAIGGLILLVTLVIIVRKKHLRRFLKTGFL